MAFFLRIVNHISLLVRRLMWWLQLLNTKFWEVLYELLSTFRTVSLIELFGVNSWSISQSTTSTYRFWVRGIRWWVGPRGSQNHGLNFPAQLSCWEINVFDFFLKMTKIFIDWRADVWIGFSQLLSIVHEQTIYHLKDLGARISGMVLILLSVDSVLRICKKGDFIVKLRAPMKPRGDFAEKRLIFSGASFSTIYVSFRR